MTPAERQRRHRENVTHPPMTKSERESLARLVRNRERVLKTAASERSAELLAEFEQQMASTYSYDQDEIWRQATAAADQAVATAQAAIAARCKELGIPARFAPGVGLLWHGRGENASRARRVELRAVAKSRIDAIEKAARTKIETACLEIQSKIIVSGLTSAAALEFVETMPSVEALMPPLTISSVEDMLQAQNKRIARYQPDYDGPSYDDDTDDC